MISHLFLSVVQVPEYAIIILGKGSKTANCTCRKTAFVHKRMIFAGVDYIWTITQ